MYTETSLEDNIKMDLKGIVCGCFDLVELSRYSVQWRVLVGMVLQLRGP